MNNSSFISYRRLDVSSFFARAVFQDLRKNDFDVFMDVESIDSGQFDTIILNQIAARPYFLLILTPGSLDRCKAPGDWLLREMEHAYKLKRTIIPLCTPNFSFEDIKKFLGEPLATELLRYNAVTVLPEYFEAAMNKLRTQFLKPTNNVLVTPTPKAEKAAVKRKIATVATEQKVTALQLSAQEFLERALNRVEYDLDGKIADYTDALRLNPNLADAFCNRGAARQAKGDLDEAIQDYTDALRLNPQLAGAFCNRGTARQAKGDLDEAIQDYTDALRLNPQLADAYYRRGQTWLGKGNNKGADSDFKRALKLNQLTHLLGQIRSLELPHSSSGVIGGHTDM